jgi:hypothetical protein
MSASGNVQLYESGNESLVASRTLLAMTRDRKQRFIEGMSVKTDTNSGSGAAPSNFQQLNIQFPIAYLMTGLKNTTANQGLHVYG